MQGTNGNVPFPMNRFSGFCRGCRKNVSARAGALMGRRSDGRWRVMHISCIPENEWVAAADAAWAGFDDPQR